MERLRAILSEMNGRDIDWVEVSKQLGGNRVPLDCMRQGLTRRTHQWTEETDKRLLDAIDVYGQHNWQLGMKFLFLHQYILFTNHTFPSIFS